MSSLSPHLASTDVVLPSASVVIVNKNDDGIIDTLEALHHLEIDQRAQVIVVDASQGRYRQLEERFGLITWIAFTPTPGRSIAAQRNVGVRASTGDVVIFLDANCVPVQGWLEAMLTPIALDPRLIVSGAVSPKSVDSVHVTTPHDLGADGSRTEFGTMNVAIPHLVFEELGGFDEELGFAEDVDLSWRSQGHGFRIVYSPEGAITHEWGGYRENLQRGLRYGIGRARLLRKHPRWRRNLLGSDRATLVYALFLLGVPLTIVFPFYPLVLAYPAWKNRRHQPLRTVLYGLVYSTGFLAESLGLRVFRLQRR